MKKLRLVGIQLLTAQDPQVSEAGHVQGRRKTQVLRGPGKARSLLCWVFPSVKWAQLQLLLLWVVEETGQPQTSSPQNNMTHDPKSCTKDPTPPAPCRDPATNMQGMQRTGDAGPQYEGSSQAGSSASTENLPAEQQPQKPTDGFIQQINCKSRTGRTTRGGLKEN